MLLEFASEAILYFFISLLGDLGEKILSFAEVTGDAIRSSKNVFYIFRLFMTKSGYWVANILVFNCGSTDVGEFSY